MEQFHRAASLPVSAFIEGSRACDASVSLYARGSRAHVLAWQRFPITCSFSDDFQRSLGTWRRGQTSLLRSRYPKTLQSLLGSLTGSVTSISFCPADHGDIFNTMNVNKLECKIASRKMLLLTEKPADPVFLTAFLGSQICVLLWAEMVPLASARPV